MLDLSWEMVSSCVAGLCLGNFLFFYGQSAKRQVDFVVSGLVAGAFMYSQMSPSFDPAMKLFGVMLTIVVLVGALVAGVVGVLLPKISIGLELGILVSLFFAVTVYGGLIVSLVIEGTVTGMFCINISLAVMLTQRYEHLCSFVRTGLATGLVFAISIDFLLGGGLVRVMGHVLRVSPPPPANLCFSACNVPALLVLWAFTSICACFLHGHWSGALERWRNGDMYTYMPLGAASTSDVKEKPPQQKTFSYPDQLEFNFFDPDNLPEELENYADSIFTTVQALAKAYGFQVDSSRNQAEHLLMMLTNEIQQADDIMAAAPTRLHTKLFSNYRKWCDRMGTPPLFSTRLKGKQHVGFVEDMLVYLLVWGEAANLRHLPECLCFLYHKTMEEHKRNPSWQKVMYPGYFLDMIVTPIYEVIRESLIKGGDHDTKKTYDDFNEFFWAPSCLSYSIHEKEFIDDMRNLEAGGGGGYRSLRNSDVTATEHVSIGLRKANKTYVEKRSWLHPLLSMHRVFEWHVVTFSILATWAFAVHLQWDYSYTLQIGSFVFWEITVMSILWTSLEVWSLFPNADITLPSVFGFLLRLVAGFLVLCYQSVYFHWSFRGDGASSSHPSIETPDAVTRGEGSANFWWWQYVWLSLAALSLYVLESFLCWRPSIVSSLMTWNNDVVQALLNICYPLSQLYVGKKIDVPQKESMQYIFYWLTLIAFKLWFGFRFIVAPVTIPSLELYDDYMNFQKISFFKTGLVLFVWWFPHFLVYMIDLSIWYSMWSSLMGGFSALVDRQGAVRDSKSFRSHFMRSPLAFCQKLMPSDSKVGASHSGILNRQVSTASLVNLVPAGTQGASAAARGAPTPKSPKLAGKKGESLPKRANSSADLASFDFSSAAAADVGGNGGGGGSGNSEKSTAAAGGSGKNVSEALNEFLDVRSQRWIVFGKVWNEIILNLRATDHLSNAEKDIFVFSSFDWLSKPIYLPLYQTAGCVEGTITAYKEANENFHSEPDPQKKMSVLEFFKADMDITSQEAVTETWELVTFLLVTLMGNLHSADNHRIFAVIQQWASTTDASNFLFFRINSESLGKVVNMAANIVALLKGCIAKRKASPVVTQEVLQQLTKDAAAARDDSATCSGGGGMGGGGGLKRSNGLNRSVSTGFLVGLGNNNGTSSLGGGGGGEWSR